MSLGGRIALWAAALVVIGFTWRAYDQPSLQLALDTVFAMCGLR